MRREDADDFSEALRLAEVARAASFGDAPDVAVQRHQDALHLLGSDELPLHADVLRWQGTVLRDRGRTSEAERLYRRSLRIASKLGYQSGVAHALNCLAGLAQRRGHLGTAAKLLGDAHVLADGYGDRQLIAMIQANLAVLADIRGDVAAAITHFKIALHAAEAIRDDQQIVRVLINYGYLLVKQHQFDEAERAFGRGLGIAQKSGDRYYEGLFAENRAELHLLRGELDEAQALLAHALDIAEQRRDDLRKAAALKLRGAHERLNGHSVDATDTLRYGLTLAAVGEDALLGAEILYQFGQALDACGDRAMANEVWQTALDAFERIAAREWTARVRERLERGATGAYL